MVAKFLFYLSLIITLSCFNFNILNTEIDLNIHRNSFIKDTIDLINHPIINWLGDDNECMNREKFEGPDFFKFFPSLKAVLKKEGDSVNYWNGCFNSNTIKLEKLSKEETIIKLDAQSPTSRLCKDTYMITTSNIHQIKVRFMKGVSTYTLKNLTDDDILEIKINGFRLFSFCEDVAKTIVSIYKTIILFGDSTGILPFPINNEKEVMDFLRRYTDYKIEKRDPKYENIILDLDQNLIQSGDFMALYRPSGVSSLIMYASGSHISHSAMAFRIDGELYVLESDDHGVIRTKYMDWVIRHHKQDYMIGWIPLKPEVRAKFNEEKAFEWFKSKEGGDFGYHNILFASLDAERNNSPSFIDSEFYLLLISLVEKYDKNYIRKFFVHALNKRLNSNLNSIPEIAAEAARQGITFEQLIVMPEKDEWTYDTGDNYFCSALVTSIYKAAGLFGDLQINAKEFTPKDVYMLDFFDTNFKDKRPQVCKDADPELEYCQITGKYKMNFDKVSTVSPYNRMNERCECVPPVYKRNEGC